MIDRDTKALYKVIPKEHNSRYYIEHHKGWFYLVSNYNSPDLRVLRLPVKSNVTKLEEFIPYCSGVCYDEVDMFESCFAIYGSTEGVPFIQIYDFHTNNFHEVKIPRQEEVFHLTPGVNSNYFSSELRFYFSSPITPEVSFSLNLSNLAVKPLESQKFKGKAYKPSDFLCKRVHAPSHDGTEIPITLLSPKHTQKHRQ